MTSAPTTAPTWDRLLAERVAAGDPTAIAAKADDRLLPAWAKAMLKAGDPTAHAIYAAHQREVFGGDPLAEGAHP